MSHSERFATQTSKTPRIFHDAIVTTKRILEGVDRKLDVVFIGPRTKARVDELALHFPNLSVVTANGAMLAANRREFIFKDGRLQIRHDPSLVPTTTFERNTRMAEHAIEHILQKRAERPLPDPAAPKKVQAPLRIPNPGSV